MLFNPLFGLPGFQPLRIPANPNKENKEKTNNKIVSSKDNFEIIPNKIYDEINIKINTIGDLIELGKMYKEDHNYAINLKRLYNLIPTLEKLENVVGMENVKKTIVNQIVYFLSGLDVNDDMLHTVITGPPGVGKTLLGNIIGEIYYKLGIVNGNGNGKQYIDPITKEEKDYVFKIAKRSDLIGEYLGHTAIKTQKVIDECEGGVLFIDEAYSLGNEDKKDIYSKECIDTLNQNLTEKKTQFICIIAGYPDDLDKCFFSVNDGLKRRFPFKYNIDKYTPTELTHILMLMIKKKNWKLDTQLYFDEIIEFMKTNYDKFPNYGGDIETLFFNIRIAHSLRTIGKLPSIKKYISIEDITEGLNIYSKSQKIENNNYLNLYT
jgi:SpoVK/Ycf46/Vps4 family AAA+-type ATPase